MVILLDFKRSCSHGKMRSAISEGAVLALSVLYRERRY